MAKQISQFDYIGYMQSVTKANPAVILVKPEARPVNARVAVGAYVYLSGTGWASLDGRTVQVNAVNAAAGTITVAADTSAEAGTLSTTGVVCMHN